MKHSFSTLLLLFLFTSFNLLSQKTIITDDIDHFWEAYDKVVSTKDSVKQLQYINELYINKGSEGLKALMEVRSYTDHSFVDAINNYPKFWESIRSNTLKSEQFGAEIEKGIQKLKELYPSLKPAQIYFTIGALRTGGTTLSDKVLIGSEIALTDKNTVHEELPETFDYLEGYFKTEPVKNVVFLNVHEYVHTQQKTTIGQNLIQRCIIEGVAEFTATKALGMESPNPQIKFGQENAEKLRSAFTQEIFSPYTFNWLWNSPDNQFGMRDLGYYIGYAICESFYNKAQDKQLAIKEMIELDYLNDAALFQFVNQSGYFDTSLEFYEQQFDQLRPKVVKILPFENGSKNVDPTTTNITVHFSEPMDKRFSNFNYGSLGETFFPEVPNAPGFSEDGTSFTLEVNLKPKTHYQFVVGNGFSTPEAIALKPYVIEFKTR